MYLLYIFFIPLLTLTFSSNATSEETSSFRDDSTINVAGLYSGDYKAFYAGYNLGNKFEIKVGYETTSSNSPYVDASYSTFKGHSQKIELVARKYFIDDLFFEFGAFNYRYDGEITQETSTYKSVGQSEYNALGLQIYVGRTWEFFYGFFGDIKFMGRMQSWDAEYKITTSEYLNGTKIRDDSNKKFDNTEIGDLDFLRLSLGYSF